MKLYQLGVGIALGAFVATPTNGALLISEVVFNEVGSDTTGEWIEIYNNGNSAIDLSNYKIGDEETLGGTSTTEATLQFPSGSSIAAGEVQIIGVNATRFFTVYGFNPDYEIGGTDIGVPDLTVYSTWDPDGGVISMSNTNDQAVLIDGTDTIIDAASWGSSTFAFNPALGAALDGQSYQRIDPNVDTDTAADWETVGTVDDAAAARSTPGVVPEPSALAGVLGFGLLGLIRRKR